MFKGKKILLGITGSIAAYKAILLIRLLKTNGAEVKVIVTPAAKDFVSALTLSTLSGNKVSDELFEEGEWSNHVMLGRWADIFIIAPLSCNTLAKMASGVCDNLLLATYLSATCPVIVAPAMDEDMWKHASTKANLEKITGFGNKIIPVGKGELASGLIGEGRLAEPEEIVNYIKDFFFETPLKGKRALVTAGPTFQALDPVRFIGNHSSGKMGIAIATELFRNGAQVTLVIGPSHETILSGIDIIRVTSAEEMYEACEPFFKTADIMIMAAAVADYTPTQVSGEKIKKNEDQFELKLTKTKDILRAAGKVKTDKQFLAGFALETTNEKEHALKKLKEKNADMIILNSLQDKGAGFGKDTNKITIFDKRGGEKEFEVKEKIAVAKDIIHTIINYLNAKANS